MSLRAFIFDLDSTLVDSHQLVLDAFRHAVEPYGISINPGELETLRSQTQDTLFTRWLNPEQNREALKRLTHFSMAGVHRVKAVPGIETALQSLAQKGYALAVWTGRDRQTALEILKTTGLARFFREVQGGCDVSRNKPHPEGLLRLLQKMALTPQEVAVVGDHEHDIMGARQIGAQAFHASWCYIPAQFSVNPDQRFLSVEAFSAWLLNCQPANNP